MYSHGKWSAAYFLEICQRPLLGVKESAAWNPSTPRWQFVWQTEKEPYVMLGLDFWKRVLTSTSASSHVMFDPGVDSVDISFSNELQGFASVRAWPVNGKVLAAKPTCRPSLPTTGGFVAQKTGGNFVASKCSIIAVSKFSGMSWVMWHSLTSASSS